MFAAPTLSEGTLLSGAISMGRTTPESRTYSEPWLMPIHFSPRMNRFPLGRTRVTVQVMKPVRLLLWALSPSPANLDESSMLALNTGLPLIVTDLPSSEIPGKVWLVDLAVFVVALFLAAVDSFRVMVTVSPIWRATGFSNNAT